MAHEIEILPIAEDHIEGFHACLDIVCRERRYLGFVEAPPLESTRTFVRGNIERAVPQFVAVEEGRVVGWCDIMPVSLAGFSHVGRLGMGIHPEYRGRGLGRGLAEHAIRRGRELGMERIELEVFASNEIAIALYHKLGFETEGVKRRARKLDGRYDDNVQMALLFDDASPR